MNHYIVKFDPFAIRFPDGFFLEGIRWYGLSYLAGFLVGLLLLNFYSTKKISPLSKDQNSSLITYLLFGVIIGGRLGYMLLYDFHNFISNPLTIFEIWRGGMASHGGFVGIILAVFLFCKFNKQSFLKVSDLIACVGTFGIFLGRLANFINGELWGKISQVKWAMIFPHSDISATNINDILPRHPSQLYEAFAEGLFIFIYLQIRLFKGKPRAGQLAGEFFVLYGIARIVCEVFREPDIGVSLILGLSRGTFYSIFCLFLGVFFIAISRMKKNG